MQVLGRRFFYRPPTDIDSGGGGEELTAVPTETATEVLDAAQHVEEEGERLSDTILENTSPEALTNSAAEVPDAMGTAIRELGETIHTQLTGLENRIAALETQPVPTETQIEVPPERVAAVVEPEIPRKKVHKTRVW